MVSGMIQCNEGIIYGTWGSMPSVLEDKSKFSVLGLCVTDPTTSNGLMNGKEDDKKKFSSMAMLCKREVQIERITLGVVVASS